MEKVKNIYASKWNGYDEYNIYIQLDNGIIIQANVGCDGTRFLPVKMEKALQLEQEWEAEAEARAEAEAHNY
jgi:hypothetical protein